MDKCSSTGTGGGSQSKGRELPGTQQTGSVGTEGNKACSRLDGQAQTTGDDGVEQGGMML